MPDFSDAFALDPTLLHFNHAAVGPWPVRTRAAVCAFAEQNARRGSLDYPRWLEVEQRLRDRLRQLIGARGRDEIALVKNTSEAISMVAQGLDWRPGDNLVISDQEFPSNRIPWEALAPRGVEVRIARLDAAATPEQALADCFDHRTRLLSVSAIQYATGLRLDLARLGRLCEQREILFCIDAIQSLGAVPLDVRAVRADFVMADAHKWLLGPEGIALFYCRRELLPRLELHEHGWHMVERAGEFERTRWEPAASARRFECGSPNMLGIHGFEASLSLLQEIGLETITAGVRERIDRLIAGLDAIPGIQLQTPRDPARRGGILALRSEREDSATLFQRLTAAGVFCALRGGNLRLSPHFHTPLAQVDRVLELIAAAG